MRYCMHICIFIYRQIKISILQGRKNDTKMQQQHAHHYLLCVGGVVTTEPPVSPTCFASSFSPFKLGASSDTVTAKKSFWYLAWAPSLPMVLLIDHVFVCLVLSFFCLSIIPVGTEVGEEGKLKWAVDICFQLWKRRIWPVVLVLLRIPSLHIMGWIVTLQMFRYPDLASPVLGRKWEGRKGTVFFFDATGTSVKKHWF